MLIILIQPFKAFGQLPVCPSRIIHCLVDVGSVRQIWNYDPSLPVTSSNPVLNTIAVPTNSNGLTVGPNLHASTPSPTFYTTTGTSTTTNYSYYNGTSWTNTGHYTGNGFAVNLGAGGGFIYSCINSSGEVFKYNGIVPGSLLTTVTGNYNNLADIVSDCEGNWYSGWRSGATKYLGKYNPSGILLQSWLIVPDVWSTGGFAIIGNELIYQSGSTFYTGVITANTVDFTLIPPQTGFNYTVLHKSYVVGYSFRSLIRASAVVNCQLAFTAFSLRRCCQA